MCERSEGLRKSVLRAVWPVTLVLLLMMGAAAVTWVVRPSAGSAEAAARPDLSALEQVQSGFTWMADEVKPSVVFIEVETKLAPEAQNDEDGGSDPLPPDLRDFFGPNFPIPPNFRSAPRSPRPQVPQGGQGSGVIVDPAGYILTNNHVAGDAQRITVHLSTGESYPAKLVGADPLTDLAVIKVEPDHPLRAAKLGNAANLRVGAWAMAIGFPFGGQRYGGRFDEALRYEPTVTVGVISATGRQIESDIQGRPFRDLIQTDAPINPGSSGGPLVNVHAEVIGINQAIFTSGPVGGNIGVGFAIPIDENTKSVIESLKGGEPIVRGQLGVMVAPLTPTLKSVYGADHGVFVEQVQPDMPASRAGLKNEDVILSYGGRDINSVDQFVTAVQGTKPGKTMELQVLRDGKKVNLSVTVEALSLEPEKKPEARAEGGKLGVTVKALPADQADEIGVPGGVVVESVNPRGEAARAGIQTGDVIVKINRQPVKDVASFTKATSDLKQGDPVAIRIWRGDRMLTAQIDHLGE
ncbi:MAG: trypsin-like peptidase domain-containing protein [Armatimonadota bacterium]